ncbi:hypothetical protein [Halalkalibacter alkalisediminis]|uniref:Uncharacterized protein n=1 Tax=Halalkalibacter alkalisediminis TaxID=935616 RepID=A0ABV6NQ21_9BACI|nr:hypothetical protein [Halalkalibacter alkalisediminis]
MAWVIGIGLGILAIVWLAMEVATYEDKGKDFRSFFKAFKRSLIFIIPLFAVAGVIYYAFIN